MSNYDDKLRKVFESVEAQTTYLITHEAPLTRALFEDLAGCGRDFANMIHDMPADWTGLASQGAVRNKLAGGKKKHSEDHFHSRQRGGEELVTLIKKCFGEGRKPRLKEVKEIIDKYCQVHYVTKQENITLRNIMAPGKTWKQAYKQAGVLLTDARELFGKRGRHSEVWKDEMRKKFKPFLAKRGK